MGLCFTARLQAEVSRWGDAEGREPVQDGDAGLKRSGGAAEVSGHALLAEQFISASARLLRRGPLQRRRMLRPRRLMARRPSFRPAAPGGCLSSTVGHGVGAARPHPRPGSRWCRGRQKRILIVKPGSRHRCRPAGRHVCQMARAKASTGRTRRSATHAHAAKNGGRTGSGCGSGSVQAWTCHPDYGPAMGNPGQASGKKVIARP